MPATKRVFLGIDLPPELKAKIEELKKTNELANLPLKLVEPQNSHLAVKFLDDLTDEQIETVCLKLAAAIKQWRPVEIAIGNSTVFPEQLYPKVLVLKASGQDFQKIGERIIKELETLPFVKKEKRSYTPHITLGRIKSVLTESEKNKILNLKFEAKINIGKLQLFESKLTAKGPIYKIIKEFKIINID